MSRALGTVVQRAAGAALAFVLTAGSVAAQTHLVIVSGLGGETQYSKAFASLSSRLAGAAHTRFGIPDADIVWLGEDSVSTDPYFRGRSTKVNVEAAIRRISATAKPGDQVVLVLIGHGAGDGPDSRIDLPGPDLSASDISRLLAPFILQRVAVLDLTSASGDAIATLSATGRVVITATKTSYERNESHFAGFFVDALTKDGADVDKDGRVSLFEAFKYAERETKRLYDDDGKMQTEHALLDDNGDKIGTAEPTGKSGDGLLARRFFLDAGALTARVAAGDPRLGALYNELFALQDEVEATKQRKGLVDSTAYEAQLETVLIKLARKAREIRTVEGRQ